MRSFLTSEQQLIFDRIYDYYGIKNAVDLDRLNDYVRSRYLAVELLRGKMFELGPFYKRNKQCFEHISGHETSFTDCWIVCERLERWEICLIANLASASFDIINLK